MGALGSARLLKSYIYSLFMNVMNEEEKKSVAIALGIVVLTIAAFVAFIYGVESLFYVVALLAIALGFYMAYRVSLESKQKKQKLPRKAR